MTFSIYNNMNSDNENTVTLSEAASIMGVSRTTMNNWHNKGEGPKRFKVGGRCYYKRDEITAYRSGEWIHG